MGLGAAEIVGRMIAEAGVKDRDLRSDVLPEEVDQSLNLVPLDRARCVTSVVVKVNSYASSSFVLDHPLYGVLDSSSLSLDGGYSGSSTFYSYNS